MVIEFKFSQRLLIIIKLATILGCVSGLIKIEALKRSIATTAGEIDKFVTMNKKYNKLKMLSKSYDQRSIPAYLQVFNGKTGKFAGLSNYTINDNFKEAVRMLIDREGINTMNGHALFDLMVTQSTFIKEYDGIDFKDINKTSETKEKLDDYMQDRLEVEMGFKSDYKFLSKFWRIFPCMNDPEYATDLFNIQNKFIKLIKTINKEFPENEQINIPDEAFIGRDDCEFSSFQVPNLARMTLVRRNEVVEQILGQSNYRQTVDDSTFRNKKPNEVLTLEDEEEMEIDIEDVTEEEMNNEVVAEGQALLNLRNDQPQRLNGDINIQNQDDDFDMNDVDQDINDDLHHEGVFMDDDAQFGGNGFGGGNEGENVNPDLQPVAENNGLGWGRLNIFGGMFGYIRNFWNTRVKSPHMKLKEQANTLNNKNLARDLEGEAEDSNDPDIFMILGEIFLIGNPKIGIERDVDKALYYIDKAAKLGDKGALYIIGILSINVNNTLAKEYLMKCAEKNYGACYYGLGTLYKSVLFEGFDIGKSIEYFTKAYKNKITDSAVQLGLLYGTVDDYLNFTLSDFYIREAIEMTKGEHTRDDLVAFLLQKALEGDIDQINYFVEHLANTQGELDVSKWHALGMRKFYLGDFDRAFLIFSFAGRLGSIESNQAAGYIWFNNLTKQLTCKTNSNYICASIFYFKGLIRKDASSGLAMAKSLNQYKLAYNKSESEIEIMLNELIFSIYDLVSDFYDTESMFNKASMIYDGVGVEQNKTKAISILDELIDRAWNSKISEKNFLPLYIKKYFLMAKDAASTLKSLIV